MSRSATVRAEMALIGCMVIAPEVIDELAALLVPDDFTHPRLRPIYEAALALRARGHQFDYVTLCCELETRGTMSAVGGDWVLTGLINHCPTSLHAMDYARLLAEAGARRRPEPEPPLRSLTDVLGLA